jgi:hypothetical protein
VNGPIAQNAGETGVLLNGTTSQMLSSLSPTSPVLTLEGWINLNNSTQVGSPVLIGNSNPAVDHVGYRMYLNTGVAPAVTFGNGTTSATATSGINVAGNGWVYLVATWNGSTIALYMNGNLVAQASLTGSIQMGTAAGTGLGYDPVASGSFFHGSMGHFAISPVALPGTEITNRYQNAISTIPTQTGGQIIYKQTPQPLNTNGTFDGQDDTQPWQGQNGASVQTTQSGSQLFGTNTMLVTPNGTAINPGAASELCLIAPSVQYSVSMWTISQAGWSAVQVGMNWYDQNQNFLSQSLGTSYPLTATIGSLANWTAYAPANALYAQIVVQMTGTPAPTTTLEIDTAYLVRGQTPISQLLSSSMSPIQGYDQYGNAVPAGANLNVGTILGDLLAPGSVDASKVIIAGTIVGSLIAANSIVAGMIAAGAIDGLTINGVTINGQTISATDIVISGTNGGLFTYGSGGTTVESHQATTGGAVSGNWIAPAYVTTVTVELWGSGAGGGGNGGTQFLISGGAGGGGQYVKYQLTVVPGNTYPWRCGGGGSGGSGAGQDGNDGNPSWFINATTAQAAGGHGGQSGNTGASGRFGGYATPPGSPLVVNNGGTGGDGKSHGPAGGGGGGGSGGTSLPGNTGADGSPPPNASYGGGASAVPGGGPGGRGGGAFNAPNTGQQPSVGPGGGGGGAGGDGGGSRAGGQGYGGKMVLTYTPSSSSIMVSIAGSPGTDPISGEAFPAGIMVDAINAPSVASDPIAGGPETWHAFVMDSGWSSSAGNTVPSYRLMPDKTVMVEGFVNHASFTAAINLNGSNPLPTPYRPLTNHHTAGYTDVSGQSIGVNMQSNGVLRFELVGGASTSVRFSFRYAVDI